MQRYFVESIQEGHVQFSQEDAKHISRVMRMKQGDEIIVVAQGIAYIAVLEDVDSDVTATLAQKLTQQVELPVHITIASGIPKGDKLDLITQKSTELGATAILPVAMRRSVSKWDAKKTPKRLERLAKIAKEAAEQSHRTIIPAIDYVASIDALIAQSERFDHLYFAYEDDAKEVARQTFSERLGKVSPGESILVVFGPEGGIAEEEAQALREASFQSIALGPRILRTETAPLYVLSAVSYQFE